MNKKPITIRPLKKEEETTLKSRLDKVEEIMRENDLFNLAVKYALLEEENQQLKSVLNEVREVLGNYRHYSTPDEIQNRLNEDLVDKAYIIVNKALEGGSNG